MRCGVALTRPPYRTVVSRQRRPGSGLFADVVGDYRRCLGDCRGRFKPDRTRFEARMGFSTLRAMRTLCRRPVEWLRIPTAASSGGLGSTCDFVGIATGFEQGAYSSTHLEFVDIRGDLDDLSGAFQTQHPMVFPEFGYFPRRLKRSVLLIPAASMRHHLPCAGHNLGNLSPLQNRGWPQMVEDDGLLASQLCRW